ncbi:Aspartyl protease family protein 1 [Vitis vinifera]|uniref:Aspartyl protease family protein 1 n=1 Tax=Vitis vinifera TaxID=29760 RepID=A0A438EV04_VITVI|nr:Aspartyl protease family protein 1 [Vitis vinifera]
MAFSWSVFIVILLSILGFRSCHARIFSFQMHHRFSEPVKKWSEGAGNGFPAGNWPAKGSFEYYAELAHRDRALRGRRLSDIDGLLTFSDGNSTFRISSLGFLHYTTVSLGTPGKKFLVALDTGSDLFWVPCDCSRCAPTEGTTYASVSASLILLSPVDFGFLDVYTVAVDCDVDFELSIYNPKVHQRAEKSLATIVCVLTVIDALEHSAIVHTWSPTFQLKLQLQGFCCGQVQTGSFLDIAAPNGLFGLGLEKISVPSILSKEGFIADSFSMCFGPDGIGRISFGDKGSPDQEETPFNLNALHPTYNITVTQVRVALLSLIWISLLFLIPGPLLHTWLTQSIQMFLKSFHSQAQDSRRPPDSRIPFEYCYDMSPGENTSLIPSMSLTMKGGSQFPVYDPIIIISSQSELIYCMAVVRSAELNIIGQNFMTGYRIIFDREKLVLGWKEFECDDIENSSVPIRPRATSVPPAVAVGVGNDTTKSTRDTRNFSQSRNSVASPLFHRITPELTCFILLFILLLLL